MIVIFYTFNRLLTLKYLNIIMKKESLKNLELKKISISKLESFKIKGGTSVSLASRRNLCQTTTNTYLC